MLYQVCSAWIADDPSFTLESVTGQAAVMTYLGAVLRVAWDPSRQRNWCDSKAWVGQDWFCFVRLFGGMMIDAAVAGYKSTNSAKQSAGLNNQIQANLRQLSWKF